MVVRCCLIYICVLLIYKVSLEVTVKTFVGESAILPCSYTEDKKEVDKVFWRHNDNKKVYEFSPVRNSDEVKYNNRADYFYDEFEKGNYSIKIKELETNDEGEYTCFITPADHYEKMYLIIKAKEEPSLTLIEEENQSTQTNPWIIPLIVISILTLLGVSFILYKKLQRFFKSQ